MELFLYEDYRPFLKDFLSRLPKKGHGELTKIAQKINVHSTLLSLVLSGERDLTLEQGYDLSHYLNLTPLESEYFILLIQKSRAGNHRFLEFVEAKIKSIQKESLKISKRYRHEKVLSDEQKSIFYSSWIYSALSLYTSTEEHGVSFEKIQAAFPWPRAKLKEVLDFLLASGLVIQKNDLYQMGPQSTFLENGSPHLIKHHVNWRLKSLQQAEKITEKELMFTSPISLSREDFPKIREKLAGFLKEFSQIVKDSPAEEIACLNIDFFWIEK